MPPRFCSLAFVPVCAEFIFPCRDPRSRGYALLTWVARHVAVRLLLEAGARASRWLTRTGLAFPQVSRPIMTVLGRLRLSLIGIISSRAAPSAALRLPTMAGVRMRGAGQQVAIRSGQHGRLLSRIATHRTLSYSHASGLDDGQRA